MMRTKQVTERHVKYNTVRLVCVCVYIKHKYICTNKRLGKDMAKLWIVVSLEEVQLLRIFTSYFLFLCCFHFTLCMRYFYNQERKTQILPLDSFTQVKVHESWIPLCWGDQDSFQVWEQQQKIPLLSPMQACRRQEVAVLRFSHQRAAGDQPIPARGKLGDFELARMSEERGLGQTV